MDPLTLLRTVLALTIFPGGLFFLLAALIVKAVAQLKGQKKEQVRDAFGIATAIFAVALLPLPGSPLLDAQMMLPVVALIPTLAAAVVLTAGSGWTKVQVLAAAAMVTPLLCLAASATTESLPTLVVVGGNVSAVRELAAAGLWLGIPVVMKVRQIDVSALAKAAGCAAISLAASDLLLSAGVGANPPALVAVGLLVVTLVYGLLLSMVKRSKLVSDWILALISTVVAGLAILITVIS